MPKATNEAVFVAYPSEPQLLAQTIGNAAERVNKSSTSRIYTTWEENDVAGRLLTSPVLKSISDCAFMIADISKPNFNVTFEIGFAIGCGKRSILIRSKAYDVDTELIRRVGIFDTLGYESYSNSDELGDYLRSLGEVSPIPIPVPINSKAPVYILQTPVLTDDMTRIIARTKKARLFYRSFDPTEHARMSAAEAIDSVAESLGLIIPLIDRDLHDSEIHNLRAAFLAGLGYGMSKEVLILQNGDWPVPLDYRDFAKQYISINQIDHLVAEFALDVTGAWQQSSETGDHSYGQLETLSLGSSVAENEFQTLGEYFVDTDEYHRALRGEVSLIVGRKGSGKTALFSQVRDEKRRDKSNVVVDLKPEGYQLLKLKEQILDYLEHGSRVHLITAFWEYLLLLEICRKLLEKDSRLHMRDHRLFGPYQKLQDIFGKVDRAFEADFSERMMLLSNEVIERYHERYGADRGRRLSSDEVTNLLYVHDLRALTDSIIEYLKFKDEVWILFDNLDKGWSTEGISTEDTLIIRGIIDAAGKIEKEFQRRDQQFCAIVFIRNDVYELMVEATADRGKEAKASLDWSDADLLRELIRRRLVYGGMDDLEFHEIWPRLFISHIDGEETSQYLIDRSLMRPRYLLSLVMHCRGFAVNLGHDVVRGDDIKKGLKAYSTDLILDTDQELKDVMPQAEDVIYDFLGESTVLKETQILEWLENRGLEPELREKAMSLLLWFGVLGFLRKSGEAIYIHDVGYSMKKLRALVVKEGVAGVNYQVSPAFWEGLELVSD